MDKTLTILFNLIYFVTDTYSSSVNLVTEPIQNDSLSLTCRYTGNETVDYFVWHYYAPSINTLDVVRNDSCISTIKLDTRFTNLKYKFGCSEINSNTIIFERLSLDMLIEAMSCTVRTIEQNWSSNDRLLFTYVVPYEELLFGDFWCRPHEIKDNYRNNSYRPYSEENTALEWSALNYWFKRSTNGLSVTCTKTYAANVNPVKEMVFVLVTSCQKEVETRTELSFGTKVPCSLYVANTSGYISYNYSSEGTCVQQMNSCSRTNIAEIEHIIGQINGGNSNEEIESALVKTLEVTTHEDSNSYLHHEELTTIIQALDKIVKLENWAVTPNQSINFMRTVSNLLDTKNKAVWQNISGNVQGIKGDQWVWKLLNTVSSFSIILGGTLNETTSNKERTIHTENVLLQVSQVNSSEGFTFPDANKYSNLTKVSSLQLSIDSLKGSRLFYGMLFKNVSGLLSAEATDNSVKDGFLNSDVMGARLDNWKSNSDFKVTIKFQLLKKSNLRKMCSFMTETSTTWMKEGCYLKTSDSTSATCECNHLTNFAILMSPWTESNVETETLRIITFAGCSLSTLGLVITVLVHLSMWRYLKSDRATILMHLCVAMVTSYVIFLGGVDRTDSMDLCTAVAVLLQYIYLVVFFLMFAEGIEISFAVLYVFSTKPSIKWIISAALGNCCEERQRTKQGI